MGAYYHHEKYDGTGYPNGLKGREIPEIARIIAVADAYDVMITGEGSEEELSIEQAREELIRGAGSRFWSGIPSGHGAFHRRWFRLFSRRR